MVIESGGSRIGLLLRIAIAAVIVIAGCHRDAADEAGGQGGANSDESGQRAIPGPAEMKARDALSTRRAEHSKPAGEDLATQTRKPETIETARTIHVFVALCDNDSQGIVPVSRTLGNGDDPRNNLYWGAMYGTSTFLKRSRHWETIATQDRPGDVVLERLVLRHRSSGAYLVADAYRGRNIRDAIEAFLDAASGRTDGTLKVGTETLGTGGNAAMVAFIGHNGLMDFSVTAPTRRAGDLRQRAAIVLACKSRPYFEATLSKLGCTPVLLTTGLMAPEAYTLEASLEVWLSGGDGEAMREAAAGAYAKYQKCSMSAARRLFHVTEAAR